MYRKIVFPRLELELEKYINLIYFDKTSFEFDERLHDTINFLRKYSNKIKEIGYLSFLLSKESDFIRVYIDIDILTLTPEEQQLLKKISA